MRRWRCSPVRVGIEYKQCTHIILLKNACFLQYVFKQSALCLIACLISSQQRSANTAEQQVILVQSTVVVAHKEKSRGVKSGATYCYDRVRADGTNQCIIYVHESMVSWFQCVARTPWYMRITQERHVCEYMFLHKKMILSPWPIILIILSVRSCYTLYIEDQFPLW